MDPHWLADSSDKGDQGFRFAPLTKPESVLSCDSLSLFFAAFFLLDLLDIGSNDMTLGLGGSIGPMSTVSTRDTFRSQLDVAAIDVGLVMVAVIMYAMVPLSN
jgi:hypothetical protein